MMTERRAPNCPPSITSRIVRKPGCQRRCVPRLKATPWRSHASTIACASAHGGRHRLLSVNRPGAVLGGIDGNLGAALRLRGDADDVRSLDVDHLPVVQVLPVRGNAVLLADLRHHLGPQIGARHQFRALASAVGGSMRIGRYDILPVDRLVVDEGAHAAAADEDRSVRVLHSSAAYYRCAERATGVWRLEAARSEQWERPIAQRSSAPAAWAG